VTHQPPAHEARSRPPAGAAHVDYSGAVYGSLLAASVVAGVGTLGSYPRLELVLLLLCTGVVFWAAHVFARLFGVRMAQEPGSREEVRRVCADERPILEAAVPPAVAVAISPLFGLGVEGAAWLALGVALAGQVGWAALAAVRAGASPRLTLVASAANLLLGAVIVIFKAALQH